MIAIALLAAQESGLGPVAAINATGFKMLAQAAEVSENAVLSPLGVHMALAACWIGSDGTARTGLGTALSMPSGPGAEIADQYGALLRTLRTQGDALGLASAIWLPAPPHPDLAKLLERAFDARTYKLPESEAEVARAVNEWASTLAVPAFLKNMGAGDALAPGNRFPGFGANLFLQEVLHSAAVEVDEVGTRAASGTAVRGGAIGGPTDEVSFVVDRPFLFGILDQRSGLLVFSGVCRRP